ncbi:MAG: tetratricopeptide repeat protein [Magnetococcales bacterium]|nr:tetratricopeptide repeat protein [Magnetococcales bacterium]
MNSSNNIPAADPNIVKARKVLQQAISYHQAGHLLQAINCYRQVLDLKPDDLNSLSNMGAAFQNLGKLEEAVGFYRRCTEIKPDFATAYSNLGVALDVLGRFDEAISSLKKAISIKPDYADAFANLGNTQRKKGDLEGAIASCKRAIAINPGTYQSYSNLGNCYQEQGKFEEAIINYRKALAISPNYTPCHNNLICCIDLFSGNSYDQSYTERVKWAEQHATPLKVQWSPFTNIPDPDKVLRIGYVGADFRLHSAALIFGSMLLNFNDKKFQTFCYAGNIVKDDLTQQFMDKSTRWLPTSGIDDETLAKEIRKDKIDILVDLAGHTLGNRLLTFARKPAPIQVTAWGYPLGTAMEAMDYIFADPVVVPISERNKYKEQIIDLPCVIQFNPSSEYPKINELPYLQNGYITFGAFNRLEKYNNELYKTWAEILQKIPTAKLLIKTGKKITANISNEIKDQFFKLGIENNHITLVGRTPIKEHLEMHNQIDIMLDPFPHNGGMTTLDSLQMGVPVLNCEGLTHYPVSASIIHVMGLDEWCVNSKEEYINKAVEFSQAIATLKNLRHELRGRLKNSVLGDSQLYTKKVEDIYRKIWQAWCAKQ